MKPVSKTATLLKLQVIGFNCKNAKRHILKTLIAHSSQLDKYPSYWENVDNLKKQKIIVKEVFIGTEEFNKIATQFKSTLPKAVVLKVERIQNINLWRQFQLESDRIKEKLGGNPDSVNIRYAYHGTGNTPPQTIYMSEDGFNVNYCSDGSLWGKANYFAVKSEYSHSYRHKTSKGTFQMFYARVILGRAKLLGQDKSLREPPMVEGSSNVRYDSVQGFASGSDIFMVYSNKKAYPEYLLTYKSD
ncbi:hypothetical protein FGO68_gene824 [Halteria grandinella]|uniref:Poly [ADP-ribose] polymerase n=1 Tax=Halteria grandinella TaxID=5974 RepID=A0A8J8P291_HALGN|nr:hypothetical protein FGO68_gene824 [Halteria grandinella]